MFTLTVDATQVARAVSNLGRAPQWVPKNIDLVMVKLVRDVADIMSDQLAQRSYTSDLADSVVSSYNPAVKEATIGPRAMRGRSFDGGVIMQLGTQKIPHLPWTPIKNWAEFRGKSIQDARYIWLGIRSHGVKAHPFLNETMGRADFENAMVNAANVLGLKLAALAFAGSNAIGLAET